MTKWIGLDLHKDYAHGYEWDPEGNVRRQFRISSHPQSRVRFIKDQVDGETHIAIEATGNVFHIYDILSPHAGRVVVKAKQVVRYAGLDASVHQSGEEHWQGRISKNGPALLRKLLVQAAHQIVQSDQGSLPEHYRRRVKEIGYRRAIIALARKLLIATWRLMQTDSLAQELEDEKVRRGYERTLREVKRDIAKADERPGTGESSVRSSLGIARYGDVGHREIETPDALEDT